jgi:hypothetical protein
VSCAIKNIAQLEGMKALSTGEVFCDVFPSEDLLGGRA